MQPITEPALNVIIDQIYAASTLEDAIYWREKFIARISATIARSNVFDPTDRDQICLFAAAKAQAEQAISRLQMCVARNERVAWPVLSRR
jgi:hypothetical protein